MGKEVGYPMGVQRSTYGWADVDYPFKKCVDLE